MSAKTPDLAGLPMRWPKPAPPPTTTVELKDNHDASAGQRDALICVRQEELGSNALLILEIQEARTLTDQLFAAIAEAERRGLK